MQDNENQIKYQTKCQQCNIKDTQYLGYDNVEILKFLCDGCMKLYDNYFDISTLKKISEVKNQINVSIQAVMKKLINICQRFYIYKQNLENQFRSLKSYQVEQINRYINNAFENFKIKSKIESAIYNLNYTLNQCNIPPSNLNQEDEKLQIQLCKKLLIEKDLIQAQQVINKLDIYYSNYYQIECLIIQKNLTGAEQQSDKITKMLEMSIQSIQAEEQNQVLEQEKELTKFRLIFYIQKAKIYHKKQQYIEALKQLKVCLKYFPNIDKDIENWYQLQTAKTMMKSSIYDFGFYELENLIQKNSQDQPFPKISQLDTADTVKKNFYQLDNYIYSLAYAKARFLRIHRGDIYFENQNSQEGNLQQLQTLYENILAQQPTNQKALYGLSIFVSSLGQVLMKSNLYFEAKGILNKLYQLNPSSAKAEIGILHCNLKLKDDNLTELSYQFQGSEGILGFILGNCLKCCLFRNFQGNDEQQQS